MYGVCERHVEPLLHSISGRKLEQSVQQGEERPAVFATSLVATCNLAEELCV